MIDRALTAIQGRSDRPCRSGYDNPPGPVVWLSRPIALVFSCASVRIHHVLFIPGAYHLHQGNPLEVADIMRAERVFQTRERRDVCSRELCSHRVATP
jgi:hypothetical protein